MTTLHEQKHRAGQAIGLYRSAGTFVSRSIPAELRPLVTVVVLAAATITLYSLLFIFSDRLVELAATARVGSFVYALIPIAVALVFSLVHGAFTGYFWDLLGLRAKK